MGWARSLQIVTLRCALAQVGLSKAMTQTFASRQGGVGTFAWCAPEVLQGKPCSYPADIYSFGARAWRAGRAHGG